MRKLTLHSIAVVCSLILGFVLTFRGFASWDDIAAHNHSLWLLMQYGIIPDFPIQLSENGMWIAPLWDLLLGLATQLLKGLQDPIWVRHALTFALYPLTLFWTYLLLRKADVEKSTAMLCIAFLFGIIRLGGHALVNVRDFPAAAGFLLTTLSIWVILMRKPVSKLTAPDLIMLGIVAAVPFVLRSPLLLHFGLVTIIMIILSIVTPGLAMKRRWLLALVPPLSGVAFIFLLSPRLWMVSLPEWLHPLELFSQFPWDGVVVALGNAYTSATLPLWYYLIWTIVGTHPVLLVFCLTGLWTRHGKVGSVLAIRAGKRELRLSLSMWLGFITLISLVLLLIIQPDVYDEDRHLVFLYAPLILWAALSWNSARDRTKYLLAGSVVIVSLVSHLLWWPYAYVYKSPLLLDRSPQAFMGDYRGLCVNEGIDALPAHVRNGSAVVIIGPIEVARVQYDRRRNGLLSSRTMPDYTLLEKAPVDGSYALLSTNRLNMSDLVLKDIEEGHATLLWSKTMPPDDVACVLAWYE